MRFFSLLLLIAMTSILFSCNKTKKITNNLPFGYELFSTVYDTSDLAGIFQATPEGNGLSAVFFNRQGSQKNITAIVQDNGGYLSWLYGYYYIGDGGDNDSFCIWKITDTSSFSFSFTDSGTPPLCTIYLPDTISKSIGASIPVHILYADTFLLQITGYKEPFTTTLYYNPALDTLKIPPSFFAGISDSIIEVVAAPMTHQYRTINGFKYLFIKTDYFPDVFIHLKQ